MERDLPTALPTDQAMKFIETAKDFLVWPATFLVVVVVLVHLNVFETLEGMILLTWTIDSCRDPGQPRRTARYSS